MGAHVVKHLLGEYVAWFISNTRCVCESFFDLHLHAHTAHLQALQSDTTSLLADHEDDLQDHQGEDENGDQGEDEGEDEAENDESGAFGGNNVRDPSADPFAESEAGVRVDADDSEQGFRKVRGRSGSRRGRGRGGRGGASSRGRLLRLPRLLHRHLLRWVGTPAASAAVERVRYYGRWSDGFRQKVLTVLGYAALVKRRKSTYDQWKNSDPELYVWYKRLYSGREHGNIDALISPTSKFLLSCICVQVLPFAKSPCCLLPPPPLRRGRVFVLVSSGPGRHEPLH